MVAPLLLLLACGQDATLRTQDEGPTPLPAEDEAAPEEAAEISFDPVPALVRASLDLRGIRPSIEEIEAVEAHPERYAEMVEGFLQDERFGQRVREMFSEIYLTRQDYYYVSAADFGLDNEVLFTSSVGEEPLRILSRIAEEDLPYTEIVRADWTMANEVLGAAFPVDYPEGEAGWLPVHYTDGRPAAGILSTNGLWWRYTSTDSNANRGRANAISRILVCNDYLSKPIEFDRNVNLLDSAALEDALQNNPGCVACHVTLDPIASYLYGFYHYLYYSQLELVSYHADRERMWEDTTGVAPGWMGEPGWGLSDLGAQIAGDARLPECITEQVNELLLGRQTGLDDIDTLVAHREAFLADDLRLRTLFLEVMTGEEYQSRRDANGQLRRKMLSPEQLGSSIADLTGFRFTDGGYDVLQSDTYGVRTLAGGVDGVYSTLPATEPTATIALVHERIAQAAAAFVVERDQADPDAARLFTEIDFSETPTSDREPMVAQVQLLHLRLFGHRVEPDGPEVAANLELWDELHAAGRDKAAAWAGLLSVLLRDADFLFY